MIVTLIVTDRNDDRGIQDFQQKAFIIFILSVHLFHVKILRSMDASHSSVAQCAAIPGWYEAFFHLISRRPESREHDDSSVLHNEDERQREEQDLVDTVLEIVFRVMWKGIIGYDEASWKVITQLKTHILEVYGALTMFFLS